MHPFSVTCDVAKLWQRDYASSPILRGWVTLRLNFRLKGYISHQYLWIIILQLYCWKFSHKETVADYSIEFYSKIQKNRFLSHPLGELRLMHALHLWLVGKPVVDVLFIIIELICYLLRLRRCKRKFVKVCVFQSGVGHFGCKFQMVERIAHQCPPTTVGVRKHSDCPFV